MSNSKEDIYARADRKGKIITHAVASFEWTRKEMRKRGLDPDKGDDRALFKEMCE